MPYLRRAERMQIHSGKSRLQVAEQVLVPLESKTGVETALHQDLIAAERDRLLDLLIEDFARQDVRVGRARLAVESAEIANRRADVCVVDIAVDVISAVRL